ncbi:MAG TPA: DedA family protein [Candidatus Thermoplasmatota archaeon]|nr:DedA family protein [Candidatus Thermoplasmatota archaeon]
MGLLQGLVDLATGVIDTLHYPGVFLLMAMESMVFPVPSEGVMPFAGFKVVDGTFHSVWFVALIATLGSLAGSSISYWMGARWGDSFVHRWGRWFLITPRDWELTQRFFRKTGGWSVFIARFLPAIRHLISLPAGATRMKWTPFLAATAAGAFAWNYFLAYLGYKLGQNWERIGTWLEPYELAVLGILAVLVIAYVVFHLRRMRSQPRVEDPGPPPAP